jgi:hypothetical protein
MYEEKYQEAIDKLKEAYPQYKNVQFYISNGELGYISGCLVDQINIHDLQQFVNSFLGQKVYRSEYIGYIDVYARSENEAKEFTKNIKPKYSMIKVTETDLKQLDFY